MLSNLAPWLTRYSLAPVAAIGALSAGMTELRSLVPDAEALERVSTAGLASALQPAYDWVIRTVPDETTRMLALGALVWVLVAAVLRRRHTAEARARSAD
ncbi:hypothetical protein G3573_16490 [Caulobacter sp. 17J65-9]|nr:hypothetical protein [Caulobacter sp. 17J65-9]